MARRHTKKTKAVPSKKKDRKAAVDLHLDGVDGDPLFDDIDTFGKQKDMVLLSHSDDDQSQVDEDEAILDLPSSNDDDDDHVDDKEDFFGEDQSEEEETSKWGRSKKNYYAADRNGTEEQAEEAVEAAKLHKKRLAGLALEDFGASHGGKKTAVSQETVFFSSSSSECDEHDDNEAEVLPPVSELQRELEEKERYLAGALAEKLQKIEAAKASSASPKDQHALGKTFAFLQTKERLLRAYCTHLAFFFSLRLAASAGKRDGEMRACVERLVEYRALMERVRPVEQRMLSSIDRLLQATKKTATLVDDDELQMLTARPRLDTIVQQQQKGGVQDGEEEDNASAAYKAPRSRAVPYPHEARQKKSALLADADKDLLSSEDAADSDAEDATPRAIDARNFSHKLDAHEAARMKEREAFEEEHMMRFLDSAKDRRKREKLAKPRNELDHLNKLSDSVVSKRKQRSLESDDDAQEEAAAVSDRDEEEMSDIEDDLQPAKRQRKQRGTTTYRPIRDTAAGAPRPISYAIQKNKGLTPRRPDENRNPRVRNRMRFERANKRLGSFKKTSSASSNGGKYSGESSGIRTNISRSVRY